MSWVDAWAVAVDADPMTLKREYDRDLFRGEPTDFRTATLLRLCDRELQDRRAFPAMICFQGSYQAPSDVSGSTHTGGGVLDIGWPGASVAEHDEGMCFLRRHGFMGGWCRHPSSTGFILHCHVLDVGNNRLSPDAVLQLQNLRHNGDGLWPLVDGDDPMGCRPDRYIGWDFTAWRKARLAAGDLTATINDLSTRERNLQHRLHNVHETRQAKRDRLHKLQHERLTL